MAMLALPAGLRHRQVVILEEIARRLAAVNLAGDRPHSIALPTNRYQMIESAAAIVADLEHADTAADAQAARKAG